MPGVRPHTRCAAGLGTGEPSSAATALLASPPVPVSCLWGPATNPFPGAEGSFTGCWHSSRCKWLEQSNRENKCLLCSLFFTGWFLELADVRALMRVRGKSFALGRKALPCSVLLK